MERKGLYRFVIDMSDTEEEDFSFLDEGNDTETESRPAFIPTYTFDENENENETNDDIMIIEPVPLDDMTEKQIRSFHKLATTILKTGETSVTVEGEEEEAIFPEDIDEA